MRGKSPALRVNILPSPPSIFHSANQNQHFHTPMNHLRPQTHIAPADESAAYGASSADAKRGKKRGSYNCGRCGLPKKGHNCNVKTPTSPSHSSLSTFSAVSAAPSSASLVRQPPPNLRRALSFEDAVAGGGFDDDLMDLAGGEAGGAFPESDLDLDLDSDSSGLPMSLLWEVLRRLPPAGLLSAARVSRVWRETTKRLWRASEELNVRVPARVQVGSVASMLQKCPGIVKLSIKMESDVDSTMLACIAFSCPNLEYMEISTTDTAINRINGDELSRFVSDKKSLKSLKMEGCCNLGRLVLCSSSLSTLWLSDLFSLSKMVFNCPQLREISLEFSHQENDGTDLKTLMEGLGRSCPSLQNIHISSMHLSHAVVLAITAAHLRELRMLSLVLGSEITDASVAAIASSYPNLELLDLSGSGISDSGIGMICNVFSETLTRLLLALCPCVSSSGIQFAMAQLPNLELMDCGMTICDPNSDNPTADNNSCELQHRSIANGHLTNQKLIIKHSRLKKLSLWGCSGLDALYLNCPQLTDLNLNSCRNLHPERLLLQCPGLENVHASCSQDLLSMAIQNQVRNAYTAMENLLLCKRLPDGSKKVRVPHHLLSNELKTITAKPLLLRTVGARHRNRFLLPVARDNKFSPLPFAPTGYGSSKIALFKVLSAEKGQVHIVEKSGVEELYDELAARLLPSASVSSSPNFKHIVGLAGPPGAGKSTLAHEVVSRVNKLWPERASSMDSQQGKL
ncbi:F-box/LRR-repeat protein 17 isoform X3 [Arachis ipaensis]|uniref:F-box/LRR-repeat protein 17 isoform X3 n=1 Tax=Arachis ipaensis TaxID=130454 RepID=UPI000A2B2930|nr:F-box/LRR-repeat protein 17 isoform X3 [Arachis ipaensis]